MKATQVIVVIYKSPSDAVRLKDMYICQYTYIHVSCYLWIKANKFAKHCYQLGEKASSLRKVPNYTQQHQVMILTLMKLV